MVRLQHSDHGHVALPAVCLLLPRIVGDNLLLLQKQGRHRGKMKGGTEGFSTA